MFFGNSKEKDIEILQLKERIRELESQKQNEEELFY